MYKELISDLHKLADVMETIDHIQCDCTIRKAAHTIEKISKENEEYRAKNLVMDTYPSEYAKRILGQLYYMYYKWRHK